MIEYNDLILKTNSLFQKLNDRALVYGQVEGNICFSHPYVGQDQLDEDSYEKRYNLWSLATSRDQILEVGFNAGHSSLMMLLSNRDAHLTVFDIEKHAYTRPCFELLQNFFPNMRAHYGDSNETLPKFAHDNPNARFDLIHIDGGHEMGVLEKDFQSAKLVARKDTIVVVDDTRGPLGDFINQKVQAREIRLINRNDFRLKKTPDHQIFTYL